MIGMQKHFLIKDVKGREILDSRGNPTLEVDVVTEGGFVGRASTPAGRSRGKHEAAEIRDGSRRYRGLGVQKAVKIVNETVAQLLRGRDVRLQREIDQTLIEYDGTEEKSRLGGNVLTATSLAVAKAAAGSLGLPLYKYIGGSNAHVLPVPMFLYVCGGKLAATDLDFQEFNAMPVGAKSFSEAMQMGCEVYHALGDMLAKRFGKYSLNVGDEGSFSPPHVDDPEKVFETILDAIESQGYGGKFVLALDAAATHLYNLETGKYSFRGRALDSGELMEVYVELAKKFPLASIEDPFHEEDFEGFAELTRKLSGVQIVGDDLFASNIRRLKMGVRLGAANTVLLKVNQIGTLSEALDTAEYAIRNNYSVLVSERSAQTEDVWLAELAVAINAGQIKNGAPARGERVAQFNQLLRIEEELGPSAKYAGENYRNPI